MALLGIFIYGACLILLGTVTWAVVSYHHWRYRGVTLGPPPDIPLAAVYPYGLNVSLEQYDGAELETVLETIKAAGFYWVRQYFPWAEIEPERGHFRWESWDRIVTTVQEHGLELIAVLDTSPAWARKEDARDNPYGPPAELADFGHFARAFAERYGATVDHYQVWDEPNIQSHWGHRYVDPVAYTALLREGYIQIKGADPDSLVLSAGLAPTTENGPLNLNESQFLRGMYAAGAGSFFDILAAKPYGFWSGPQDRRVAAEVLNFSRVLLLREQMVAQGDGDKPVWAVEFGWNSLPHGWRGRSSPWGTDAEELQARRTLEAMQRAQEEWPWLGVMTLSHFQPQAPADDPRWGFALVTEDGEPRLLLGLIQEQLATPPLAHVGHYAADHYLARYIGKWRLSPWGADIGQTGDELLIPFRGTGLDVTVRKGNHRALLYVTVDGGAANRLPQDGQGRSYLTLYDRIPKVETVTVARGLADTPHQARLVAQGGWGQWAIVGWTVIREENFLPYRLSLILLAGTALVVSWRLLRLLYPWPWLRWIRRFETAYQHLGEAPQVGVTLAAAALFYFVPGLPLSFFSLVVLALLIYLRPDLGLTLAVLAIPFFLYPKHIGGKMFSMVEILTLVTFAGWVGRWVVDWAESSGIRLPERCPEFIEGAKGVRGFVSGIVSRASGLDYAVIFFALLCLFSLTIAANFGVAAREFRVVVLEPVLLYWLLLGSPLEERKLLRLVEALILAGLLVSLFGLYQYFFTQDIITAEGVRRIRGVYASPNNLSLFLGRIGPLVIALAAFGRGWWRRLAYALAGVPILFCLYLTYSRGAWLLGLPAAFLFIGFMRGRRARLAAVAIIVLALLSLLPLVGNARLSSLLDIQKGTTFMRLKLWEGSVAMIADHPLFGVGLDNFLYQYARYMRPEAWREPDLSHPHNILLDYWTRLGVLGVVAGVWLIGGFFGQALPLYRRLPEGNRRALVLGLMASMVDFLAHGLIDNSYFLVDLAFIFFLTVGVVRKLGEE